ncbi:MAG: phage holin family protein [Methylomicrobium sp.]|nr:phage holin family protein [Methylomicrobium sp.]
MIEKDPLSYEVLTYGWVVLISLWGGVTNYARRLKNGRAPSIAEFIGDISISGFVGVITFFLCESSGIDKMLSAAMIGVSAHMGSRSLFALENIVYKWLKKQGMVDE